MARQNWAGVVSLVLGLFLILTVMAMVSSLFLGTIIIFSPAGSARDSTDFGYIGPFGILWFPLSNFTQGIIALLAANLFYLVFFYKLLTKPTPVRTSILRLIRGELKGWRDNAALALASVFGFLIATHMALQWLLEGIGLSTGSLPRAEPLSQFVSIALAPLNEELTFRLLTIGMVAGVVSISKDTSLRSFLGAIWRPGTVVSRPGSLSIWIAWLISGLYFGLAHFLYSGGTWGPGKAITASLQGLAIGFLHINYGFHAAVLLHWAFNYHGTVHYYLNALYNLAFTRAIFEAGQIIEIFTVLSGTLLVMYILSSWAARQIYRMLRGTVACVY